MDEFWMIALNNQTNHDEKSISPLNIIYNDNDGDDTSDVLQTRSVYKLHIVPYGDVQFNLNALPTSCNTDDDDNDDIPLGAMIWYGSALLAAMILQPYSHTNQIQRLSCR